MASLTLKKNTVNSQNKFDSLPVIVQFLLGLLALIAIAVIGFTVFYILDFLLLDFDPIGRLASAISTALEK
ncbi:MAG: hypothetical protein IKO57_11605 [Treponema sp.]|nr:hypothetical protein [Treponema sp.]MBR4631066.1 hypothetical protein [Treponema sp.]MBR6912489.1 hypothetical protein [Treponema sp.]MCR5125584.1 hypothetical protein [Treponema sp.]